MTQLKRFLFFLSVCCCLTTARGQYITVDDTYTAQQLVQNVLVNSPCANVSNFSVTGDSYSPGEQSFGYFNGVGSGFPFSNGIVLSTARAHRAEGPNNNLVDEGSINWLGDTDLEQALNITGTVNATALEFDFTPLTSKISFDYIFASEEYQGTAPCRYSDGFAFLLRPVGSSGPYQNLALIPNTNTPVKVTTVHPNISGSCPAMNDNYFGGFNNSSAPINFNGQTTVMTAQADVIPGTTYHIKLVIADEENIRYDSAIFLGGGSFNVGTDLGPDRLVSTNNSVCQGETYLLDATEPAATGYKWYRNNVLEIGQTNPTYVVSAPGTYKVEVTLGTGTCVAIGEATIEYTPLPVLNNTTIVQCDANHDGTALYNLTTVDDIIRNNDATLGSVSYYETLAAAQFHDSTLLINDASAYTSVPKTIYASVTNANGCSAVASVALQITSNTLPSNLNYEVCDTDGTIDGFYSFNLSAEADPVILAGLPPGLVVEYYPSITDALVHTDMLPNTYINTNQYQILIYAKILNGPDCYGIIPLHLYVNSLSPPDFGDETVTLCENSSVTLEVASTFSSYSWSNSATTFQTQVSAAGEYTVTVSDVNGCQATKKFIVVLSQTPHITDVLVGNFDPHGGSIAIEYSGLGDFEFSINNINFQDSAYFANVPPGEYVVIARDKHGCGSDSENAIVLDYPKYFTPNNDGYNDFWFIKNLKDSPGSRIDIFDRFGKLLKQLSVTGPGWDGKLNKKELPSDDYWFVLYQENKTIKGHFSLKR